MGVHEKIFCMSEADLYDRDLKVKDHFKWTNRFYNDFDPVSYTHLDVYKRQG